MSRLLLFSIFSVLFINISCERCMQCTYSYVETVIEETPDGEQEKKIEHKNLVLIDADGESYTKECVERKDYKNVSEENIFSIENYYLIEQANSDLDSFKVQCAEL